MPGPISGLQLPSANHLQSAIASATSSDSKLPPGVGHHPITCQGKLFLEDDGRFSCEHFEVPSDDPRTHAAVVHSVALLLIEEAMNFSGLKEFSNDV